MATIEYRPVLICGPKSMCALRHSDEENFGEHDLGSRGPRTHVTFPDHTSATEHAVRMRSKVYGPDHEIRIDRRVVTDWQPSTDEQPAPWSLRLADEGDTVDVYPVGFNNLTRVQLDAGDDDIMLAIHAAPHELQQLVDALALHIR